MTPSSVRLQARTTLCFGAIGILSASLALSPAASLAQAPDRPIRLVIPYPTGGGTDITARAIAARLSEALQQPVIIENRPGATGMVGAAYVARSTPDGQTVLFGAASEMAINTSLYRKMAYDPRTDLEPVSLIAVFPLVLVSHPATRPTLAKVLATARSNPGTITYGSIGAGSPQHLAGELLSAMAKVSLVHVPYKGSGPLVQDAIGGHVHVAISSVPPAVPLVASGRLQALAVTSSRRATALPDTQTVAELGFTGFDFSTWVASALPRGAPAAMVTRFNKAFVSALAFPEVQSTLLKQGAEPVGSTPEQLRSFIRSQIERSDLIVSRSGLQLD
jgi:tripartite-type tricarboxylate transporter receptor subunit TctC